jgi:TonB family protein
MPSRRLARSLVALSLFLAAPALAHPLLPPRPLEQPEAVWPGGRADAHDVVVPVILTVTATGEVSDAQVEVSLSPAFDEAALAAARRWKFEPARSNGKPVPAKIRAAVRFLGQVPPVPPTPEPIPGPRAGESPPDPAGHTHAEQDPPPTPPVEVVGHDHGHGHTHDGGSEAGRRARPDHDHEEVVVREEKPASEAASRVNISRRELELRPRLRPADVLEAAPGVFAVQHAGGGKANQYFLRGFDADHGTDIGFFVDGVPVNMVSHGHGHGYTDFHFLIPELVVSLDVYKGPYYAQWGDFSTAGVLNLRLAESFEESYASLSAGQYGIARGLVVASPKIADGWRTVLAAEVFKDDGPFQNPERLNRFNVFLRATHDLTARSSISMTWMSYSSRWSGSGQIPARAVCGEGERGAPPPSAYGQPCLDRFGAVDPNEGGASQRHAASIAYNASSAQADLAATAYFTRYRFNLYSSFTYFERDPIRGDEIEQTDDRTIVGGDFRVRSHATVGSVRSTTTLGAQIRADQIENAIYHDQARERLDTRVQAKISEAQLGAYVEEDARLFKGLRLIGGLRAQRIDVSVEDPREDTATQGTRTSGTKGSTRILPKLMGIVSPSPRLDLFASYGQGFHSNDARGAVLSSGAVRLITPATGYEGGARLSPFGGMTVNATAFLLDLDSELVWLGDEGTTEASGRTRRYGVEIGARYRMGSWLFADVDATFTRARFRSNAPSGNEVPLAPRRTLTAGIGVRPTFGSWTPFGSVRVKSLADRPANEDGSLTARGFTVVDADAGARYRNIELGVDVQNVLNTRWREVSFATTTRLAYEPRAVEGIHYSPGWPRTVIGKATLYWQ